MNGQVSAPSTAAWLLDLTTSGGPLLVVLRRGRVEARAVAIGHLLDAEVVADAAAARRILAGVDPQLVAVTW